MIFLHDIHKEYSGEGSSELPLNYGVDTEVFRMYAGSISHALLLFYAPRST